MPYFKSLENSNYDKEERPILPIVGKDFLERVSVTGRDTFVKFFKNDCKHCQNMAAEWDKLAQELKPIDNFQVAEFDMEFNEVPGLKIESIPTIVLYVNGDA